jgi:iron(III) transport system substrate-binding protein
MKLRTLLALSALCLGSTFAVRADANEVNLYSAQKEHLIKPVLEKFTQKTGIEVQLITGDASGLVTRLEHEGKHSPADLLFTTDIGNIYEAKRKHLLQPIESETLTKNIPAPFRDPQGMWYGFTKRARIIFMRKDDAAHAPKSYLELGQPQWNGAMLARSSEDVYNQSLMAFIIHHHGEKAALTWAKGIVANLARTPVGGDRDQLRNLSAGEGRIAIANSYYYAMLFGADPALHDEHVATKVIPIFLDQETTGVHVNIRGGGVTAHAKHKKEAIALLEYLSSEEAQRMFADGNNEYPVNPQVAPSPILQAWGEKRLDATPLEEIGKLRRRAIVLLDEAGWR